jgi:hypothetical protein
MTNEELKEELDLLRQIQEAFYENYKQAFITDLKEALNKHYARNIQEEFPEDSLEYRLNEKNNREEI